MSPTLRSKVDDNPEIPKSQLKIPHLPQASWLLRFPSWSESPRPGAAPMESQSAENTSIKIALGRPLKALTPSCPLGVTNSGCGGESGRIKPGIEGWRTGWLCPVSFCRRVRANFSDGLPLSPWSLCLFNVNSSWDYYNPKPGLWWVLVGLLLHNTKSEFPNLSEIKIEMSLSEGVLGEKVEWGPWKDLQSWLVCAWVRGLGHLVTNSACLHDSLLIGPTVLFVLFSLYLSQLNVNKRNKMFSIFRSNSIL